MTQTITAVISNVVEVNFHDIPIEARELLLEALTIPNLAREEAKKQHQYGWRDMPKEIRMYHVNPRSKRLCMPLGFLSMFIKGMEAFDFNVRFVNHQTHIIMPYRPAQMSLRLWQKNAIDAMTACERGFWKAPAGSGKTIGILGLLHAVPMKALIIVNTKDILWQWQERVEQFFGPDYPCGQVGDGVFDVSDYITIATAQTLHSQYDELSKDGFFKRFSLVCLDEAHHATAETYNKIMSRFWAKYRLGVSATPDKTGDFRLAQLVIGDIIHETKVSEVSTLITPEVVKVPTNFKFAFKHTKNQWQRSNYPELIRKLISDKERNELIVGLIDANEGHHQLVLSKRIEHLEILESMLLDIQFQDPIVTIMGRDKNEERKEAKALAEESPCVILSTLADEAMDIPRLDRLHLIYPQKNPGLVTQQVGRVERQHDDKIDAVIYDYADVKVNILYNQFRKRRFECYEPRKYSIRTYSA